MSALHIFPVDQKQGVFWLHDGGGRFTVNVQAGECNCAKGKKTRSCRHLDAMRRYCKRHGLSFGRVLSVCVSCDMQPALMKLCATCGGTGRIPEDLAKGMRLLKWPIRSEAENVALLRLWGEKTERDIPKTRIRFRAADDEAQAA